MQKANRSAADRLRRLASVLWLAAAVIATMLICIVFFYRNPWITHRVGAEQLNRQMLDQIADSHSPYIRADRMTLTFTGYYETDSHDAVQSYCYMGETADCRVLILLPALDDGQMLENGQQETFTIEDISVKGRVVRSREIAGMLADAEQMSVEDYQNYYNFAGLEIHDFHNDQEQMRIYQLMLGVLILAALITGVILRSEADAIMEAAADENTDQMEEN